VGCNAEDTIAKAIECVLNQSHPNFRLYLIDNGSTDKTGEIMKKYARRDERVFFNQFCRNFKGGFAGSLSNFRQNFEHVDSFNLLRNDNILQPEKWVCFIDADDTYAPDYLEKMLRFVKSNDLEMAMCGWDFVRPGKVDRRELGENKVLSIAEFAENLPLYDKFTGPVWNKIFSYRIMAEYYDYFEEKFARLFRDGVFFYGADTCFVYFMLSRLDKIGILGESLYRYNILDTSESRGRFNPMLVIADRRLAEVRFDFLQEIGMDISDENRAFILNIYFKSAMLTAQKIIAGDMELKDKMKYLHEIFNYKLMGKAFELPEQEKYL
jgi:glycosyltransferase involved in cell wall biosynthesis